MLILFCVLYSERPKKGRVTAKAQEIEAAAPNEMIGMMHKMLGEMVQERNDRKEQMGLLKAIMDGNNLMLKMMQTVKQENIGGEGKEALLVDCIYVDVC